jgi:phosphoglycerate dehydrogenase-like enzyme
LNIAICRAEGANARGVAELTISLIFALARSIPFSDTRMKAEKWERRKGSELEGRTLGLVGCGAIGKHVALMAAGIGMNVVAYRRHPDRSFAPERFRWVSLEDLYEQSDFVSLHLPALDKPLIDKAVIGKMKKGVYLVNTSRGALVDEDAVLEALDSGQIAGFATDVYTEEPPSDHRLVKHDRVIATPHIGGYTTESVRRAMEIAVDNLLENLKE